MVHLYIGDGKGKTTASIGQAIRTLGWGDKVLFVQFLKSWDTGEIYIFEKLDGLKTVRPVMRHKGFIWQMNDTELSEVKEDIQNSFANISALITEDNYSLVVLDEILDAIDCGFLNEDCVISLINQVSSKTEMILTGRNASSNIMERSDYITDMVKVKHPYDKGLNARKGIEY